MTIKRIGYALSCLATLAIGLYLFQQWRQPALSPPTAQDQQWQKQVTIYRDEYGIAHIHGRTDAATAYGFAYAHSEDDFPTIQASLIAARGQLSRIMLSKLAAANDFLVALLDVKANATQQFDELPEDFKKLLNAYAAGLNHYAYLHPEEADRRFFPITATDIIAGFSHKLPLMMGVGNQLQNLFTFPIERLQIGDVIEKNFDFKQRMPDWYTGQVAGSNAHAVHHNRASDDITRLNINSHQPWEGPVAWYEAHLMSDEGWNMIGGTFPGAPVILHGHNSHLGWAHTVNRPDFVDIYQLTVRHKPNLEYQFDGQWLPLEELTATITLDLKLFEWNVHKPFYKSQHGAVIERDGFYYAIRFPGQKQQGKAVHQWYTMNKATDFSQWRTAMQAMNISMMNTVYADMDNIYYLYNGNLPVRNDHDVNWRSILPGDTSSLIWQSILPFEKLPQVLNPPSGFIMNTNTTPFITTIGEGNPKFDDYDTNFGIEKIINNRGLRSHETFGQDTSISREAFIDYKFDLQYSKHSSLYLELLNPLIINYQPQSPDEETALNLLRNWNGSMTRDNTAASLVRLIHEPWHQARTFEPAGTQPETPSALFQQAVTRLRTDFGSVEVALGDLQKLQRGKTLLPIDGGVDTLMSVHTKDEGKQLIGKAGDSYILIAEFSKQGVESWALHQYGNVNRKDSPHYDDQAELFQNQQLRKSLFELDEVKSNAVKSYHPGGH